MRLGGIFMVRRDSVEDMMVVNVRDNPHTSVGKYWRCFLFRHEWRREATCLKTTTIDGDTNSEE